MARNVDGRAEGASGGGERGAGVLSRAAAALSMSGLLLGLFMSLEATGSEAAMRVRPATGSERAFAGGAPSRDGGKATGGAS